MSGERRLPGFRKVVINGNAQYPPEARAQAKSLRESGLSYHAIAQMLGVGWTTIARWLDPKYAERARAWHAARPRRPRHRYEIAPENSVTCLECGQRFYSLAGHLKVHGLNKTSYRAKHGSGAPMVSENLRFFYRDFVARQRVDVICLECGKGFQSLIPHLRVHGLTAKSYSAKHGPPHPLLVAENPEPSGLAATWRLRKYCSRGHRLTPQNRHKKNGQCLRCLREYERKRRADPAFIERRRRYDAELWKRRQADPDLAARTLERRRALAKQRYQSDPKYRKRYLARQRAAQRKRYAEDPEYRARIKAEGKARFEAKKKDPKWRERERQRRIRAQAKFRKRYTKDPKYRARRLAKERARRARNREQINAEQRARRAANRERYNEQQRVRRARKKAERKAQAKQKQLKPSPKRAAKRTGNLGPKSRNPKRTRRKKT